MEDELIMARDCLSQNVPTKEEAEEKERLAQLESGTTSSLDQSMEEISTGESEETVQGKWAESEETAEHSSAPSEETAQHSAAPSKETAEHNAAPSEETPEHSAAPSDETAEHHPKRLRL
jgi:hypothetical protein